MAEVREAGENLVPLRLERAVVEVRIRLRAGSGPIRRKRGVFVRPPGIASAHACPPNTPLNFRNALNKCTRTVAWLMPVAALISAGVRSSR